MALRFAVVLNVELNGGVEVAEQDSIGAAERRGNSSGRVAIGRDETHDGIAWARDPLHPSVMVLTGYGIGMTVHRGHLILKDGIGLDRRERRLPRVQQQVDRIVILGQTGYISLEAIRWCLDSGVAIVHIDTRNKLAMVATSDGRDDARLRRSQALATGSSVGFEAARALIVAKIQGQARVLARHAIEAGSLDGHIELAESAATLKDLSVAEAEAASRYFTAWANRITVRFALDHADRVPAHWTGFIARSSLIHRSPGARDAADPINAMLNYGYALAETECTIALRTLGLDPGMGVLHADKRARDSLALDLIEPVRPVVDDLILQLLERRVFTSDDFTEDGRGGCRLTPILAAELSGLMPEVARIVAVHAERLAATFSGTGDRDFRVRTPLTGANWHAASGRSTTVPDVHLTAPAACRICGVLLDRPSRKHCAPCWEHRREVLAASRTVARTAKLTELRSEGKDPRATQPAVTRRAASIKRIRAEQRAWIPTAEEAGLDDAWYDTEIAPRLGSLTNRTIQDELGVSDGGASKIRRRIYRPHKRYWLQLRDLVN